MMNQALSRVPHIIFLYFEILHERESGRLI